MRIKDNIKFLEIASLNIPNFELIDEGTIGSLDLVYLLQSTVGPRDAITAAVGIGGGSWKDYTDSSGNLIMTVKMSGDTGKDLDEIYQLFNIEDDNKNVTRFLVMGKVAEHPEFKKEKYITSCIFKVKDKPAALYKCLGGFATNNISLSKLESFSEHSSFEQYLFLCDIVGHIEDPKVQKSLEELGFHTVSLDILGVYKASQFRNI